MDEGAGGYEEHGGDYPSIVSHSFLPSAVAVSGVFFFVLFSVTGVACWRDATQLDSSFGPLARVPSVAFALPPLSSW